MTRLRSVQLVLVCVLVVAAMSGCASQAGNGTSLEAHAWKVAKLAGNVYSGSAPITAKFAAGKIAGSTGVNSYTATYETPKANEIAITPGAMTLMAGSPEAMKAESDYIKALKTASSYAVDEASLTLFDSSGVELVTYAVDVPTPLVDTAWTMTMYNNGHGGFQSAEASAEVTAVFRQDGTVTGKGGVNQYGATYTTTGTNTIKIEQIVATKMAGPQALMDQENAYFAALQKATEYVIEGKRLTLRDGSQAAQVGYEAK